MFNVTKSIITDTLKKRVRTRAHLQSKHRYIVSGAHDFWASKKKMRSIFWFLFRVEHTKTIKRYI